jgi:transcription elongation factor Elf1
MRVDMIKVQGTCPVCNGTKRVPAVGTYKAMIYHYHADTDTFQCDNCGGQYMYGGASGMVNLNNQGEPCKHQYTGVQTGRCYYEYTCTNCGDKHSIDSSD